MINKERLEELYNGRKKSLFEISKILKCSVHKVNYWMKKYNIVMRSISEAVYIKCNPQGDPFKLRFPMTIAEAKLFGMGIGLYWGEGNKANKDSVRLGNADPELLNKFIEFLITFFGVSRLDLHFGLQVFTDISVDKAMDFWRKRLRIKSRQFYKPVITKSGSLGTYKKKSIYGVLTVHYHNKKMRDIMVSLLPM